MRGPQAAPVALALLAAGASGGVAGSGGGGQRLDVEREADASVRPEPIGSIVIEGDDALANHPAVRSGDGTAANPYLISDYVVNEDRSHVVGIKLVNTTAHVAIQRIVVYASGHAVLLQDASNVTLQDVQVMGPPARGVSIIERGCPGIRR